jgi:hypothetical protein
LDGSAAETNGGMMTVQNRNDRPALLRAQRNPHAFHLGHVPKDFAGLLTLREADDAASEVSFTLVLFVKNRDLILKLGLGVGEGVLALLCG